MRNLAKALGKFSVWNRIANDFWNRGKSLQQRAIILNYGGTPLLDLTYTQGHTHTHIRRDLSAINAYLLCALFNQFSCNAEHRWACNYFGFCFDNIFGRPCGVACSRLLPQWIWLPLPNPPPSASSLSFRLLCLWLALLSVRCCTIWKVVVIYLSPAWRTQDMTGAGSVGQQGAVGKSSRASPAPAIALSMPFFVAFCQRLRLHGSCLCRSRCLCLCSCLCLIVFDYLT